MVYACAWSKKDIMSWNKVSVKQLLVVNPRGEMILEDSEEKTAGRYPGRKSATKMREIIRAHTILELNESKIGMEIPLANVSLRSREEIDSILIRIRSGKYEGLEALR